MTEFITIILSGETFRLSRTWIQTHLPESLLATTLEMDPNAAVIPLENKAVSPQILRLLVALSEGKEPTHHEPQLLAAHHYLNIPSTLAYADPLYDAVVIEVPPKLIDRIIKEDRVDLYAYLLGKGQKRRLIQACRWGAIKIVKRLLANPAVDPTKFEYRAVRSAGWNDHANIVKLLLGDARVDVIACCRWGLPNFAFAGHLGVVKVMVDALGNDLMGTILEETWDIAAQGGSLNVMQYLASRFDIDPNIKNGVALRRATDYGHLDVVQYLLEDKRTDPTLQEPLLLALELRFDETKSVHIAQLLLQDERLRPTEQMLVRLAANGYTKGVEILLADGRVDPTWEHNQALQVAVGSAHVDVVKVLIADPRVDPSANDNYAIYCSYHDRHTEITKVLLADVRVRSKLKPHEIAAFSWK